uniref:SFRICE_018570 n=1 Tax=Spodoptera frugiperda TaxID=7108 RepID=A0A2H1VZG2_SPOFR
MYDEMYEYIDNSNQPITPINAFDKRKLDERYKLPELKSTTTEKFIASDSEHVEYKPMSKLKPKPKTLRHHAKRARVSNVQRPLDIFYRKMTFDNDERNRPQKWTHCLDVITPYLNGYVDNATEIKKIDASSHYIRKLSHLLSFNATSSTTSNIQSTLYKINKLQLKIFQWDVSAIRKVLRVIIKNGTHDFKGLKYGLKGLFANWRIDLSNVDTFLKQSKIYRPPCLQVSEDYVTTTTTVRSTVSKTEDNSS